MLVSPRPTALLPSAGSGNCSPVTRMPQSRASYVTRSELNILQQSPPQGFYEMPAAAGPVFGLAKESSRRPPSRKSSHPATTSRTDLQRADSSVSVRSKASTSSMHRTISHDSSSSMKRTLSRDLTTTKKGPKQFVVKSKASRSHRSASTGHLARTPSCGRGSHPMSGLTMTQTNSPKREPQKAVIHPHPSAGNQFRRKALSMGSQDGLSSPHVMRRTLSEEDGSTF